MLKIVEGNKGFTVSFKYQQWIVDALKNLPGSYYNSKNKNWFVPVGRSGEALKSWASQFSNVEYQAPRPRVAIEPIAPLPELELDYNIDEVIYSRSKKAAGEPHHLFPFQKNGIAYNLKHGNVLNGDQQGLGKTIETIATVYIQNLFPCLVVSKKSLLSNWESEWLDWTGIRPMYFTSSKKTTWNIFFNTGIEKVGLVNYDSLEKFFVKRIEKSADEKLNIKHIVFNEQISIFKSVIIDESHYIKDPTVKRAKFTYGLSRHLKEKGVYLLSGTPVLNNPVDLFSQLCILNKQKHFARNLSEFKEIYGGKNKKESGQNLDELNYLLNKHCYFRRTKQEVKSDLPEKTRQVILVDITNREEYKKAETNFINYLKENLQLSSGEINKKLRGEAMVQIGILKKIAAYGKMEAIKEMVESLIEQGEKVVVFAHHQDITKQISEFFPHKSVRLCGTSKTPEEMQHKKRLFQDPNSGIDICVCSLQADSEGHTLNAASNLYMVELPWTWGKAEQVEDRIHRINNWMNANIGYLIADNTIDRYIYDLILTKKDLHEQVTGTEDDIQEQVIDKLINLFTKN